MTPEIPMWMLVQANREHWTRGIVHPKKPVLRVPIVCDGAVVGFYTPHKSASGDYRLGPVWILPEYRRRGLVRAVYATAPGPILACVENGNTASESMLVASGFQKLRKYVNGWYWRRL